MLEYLFVSTALDLQINIFYFQVVFEGVVGSSYDSDIGIDDVTVTAGTCPGNMSR